jgi:hypothetical protein
LLHLAWLSFKHVYVSRVHENFVGALTIVPFEAVASNEFLIVVFLVFSVPFRRLADRNLLTKLALVLIQS